MASKPKEQQSPVKRRFSSPLGNQKYVTKGISPRFKANLKDFRSFGPGKQSKQRDLGPNHGKPWRKPQERYKPKAVKFHCGGNSADPLNLNSLIDRDPSVVTPQASPLSVHSESPVEVLEPRDQTDPLNLKGFPPEPENKESHVTPKKRKKKRRHQKNQHDVENEIRPKEQSVVKSKQVRTISEGKRNRKRKFSKSEDLSIEKNENNPSTSYSDQNNDKSSESKEGLTKDKELETSPKKKACITIETSGDCEKEDSEDTKMESPTSVTEPEGNSEKGKESGPNKSKQFRKGKYHSAEKQEKKGKLFIYGNYNRYYGYRNPQCCQDVRLKCFRKEWFTGKDVLDLGCNVGHITLTIAREFSPHVIMGIDIDTSLIQAAKNNLRYYVKTPFSVPGTSGKGMDFPMSFSVTSGPLAAPVLGTGENLSFPHNVIFKQENYVPSSSEVLSKQKSMYDLILCLSLTKWIHLNWGDEGLKLMFKRIFLNLRPGGKFILEPQPFSSYKKKKNLTEKIRSNYDAIRFRPEHFIDYLLSDSVGFATFEVLEIPQHKAAGFQRPMYLLTKSPEDQAASSKEL